MDFRVGWQERSTKERRSWVPPSSWSKSTSSSAFKAKTASANPTPLISGRCLDFAMRGILAGRIHGVTEDLRIRKAGRCRVRLLSLSDCRDRDHAHNQERSNKE